MTTEVRVGVTGTYAKGDFVSMRREINAYLKGRGFRKDAFGAYVTHADSNGEEACMILNDLYDIERKHSPAKMHTIKIRAYLVDIEIRKNKHRSV